VGTEGLVLGLFLLVFDANRYSLYPIYRERLTRGLFARRTASDVVAARNVDGKQLAEARLSALHAAVAAGEGRQLGVHPETRLKACASVGLSDRSSRDGRAFDSFVVGEPCKSLATGEVDLKTFEEKGVPSGEILDLASIMAVSGAAVSPTMGRYST